MLRESQTMDWVSESVAFRYAEITLQWAAKSLIYVSF